MAPSDPSWSAPFGLLMGGNFSLLDYFVWNEIPTVVGNLVGGLLFTGLTLYTTHAKTAPQRVPVTLPHAAAPRDVAVSA